MARRDEDGGNAYLCIDLKSFYASVECVDRGLDPLTTKLVVADESRGPTTICLAVTPALKERGVRNRCRLFEVPADVGCLVVPPRMRRYMEVSAEIYGIYLRYISPQDIHVYSIDECFVDAAPYRALYGLAPRELAARLMGAVRAETGICATAGIGTNLFLAKVALDVMAKHAEDCIGWLDREEFRRSVWTHRPITDIWNIGPGIAKRLEAYGVRDLKGVCELDRDLLYREFGANAEYLIDHAHGEEPCTMAQIKAYKPKGHSLTNGQILPRDYTFDEAATVLKEMVDVLALDLVDRHLVTDSITLAVGYGASGGGGRGPCDVGGARRLPVRTNSYRELSRLFEGLYREKVDPARTVRRINVGVGDVADEDFATADLFCDLEARAKEHRAQRAVAGIKRRFGAGAVLRGMSLAPEATARERGTLVGGHRA